MGGCWSCGVTGTDGFVVHGVLSSLLGSVDLCQVRSVPLTWCIVTSSRSPYFEPSLDALGLRSDVIGSTKILSWARGAACDPECKQLSSSASAPSASSLGPPRSETRFKDDLPPL